MSARTSAVIAAFNQENFIVEAVEGLADQVDEVIVVDDMSRDGTLAALRSITAKNVTVLSNESQRGVSRSFNRAVEAATGEIVLIQGGDDRSLPRRASTQALSLADGDVALTASLPTVINARGDLLPDFVAGEFTKSPSGVDELWHLFTHGNYICAPAVAVRRSDFLEVGGFRGGLDLLQDYLMWMQLAARGRFDISAHPVVEYRKHGSNLSREYVGLSAPRQRRLDAELQYSRNHFLDEALPATRRRLAESAQIDLEGFDQLDADEQRAAIRLSHPDGVIKRRGLDAIFDAAAQPDFEARLARIGLAIDDIGGIADLADHENRSQVDRALGLANRALEKR